MLGDETKIRQVFMNLLGNALKFTSFGRIQLSVHAEMLPQGSVQITAEVEDTGPGIGPEDEAHLFEPFFQTSTGRHTPGGTGLGLAITREFLKLMSGDLALESQLGKGSIFRLNLKLQPGPEGIQMPASAEAENRAIFLDPDCGSCKVLVVDDEPSNRELLEQFLTPIGFEVQCASNGEEALVACSRELPDLVILDLRMPGMDGLEVARQLRSRHSQKIKIIILTACAFKEDSQRALQAGADVFLTKPFRHEELLETIKQLVSIDYWVAPPQGLPAEPARDPSRAPAPASPLPESLVAALLEAANRADYDELLLQAQQINDLAPETGREILALVEAFDYAGIVNRFSGV